MVIALSLEEIPLVGWQQESGCLFVICECVFFCQREAIGIQSDIRENNYFSHPRSSSSPSSHFLDCFLPAHEVRCVQVVGSYLLNLLLLLLLISLRDRLDYSPREKITPSSSSSSHKKHFLSFFIIS